MKLTKLTWLVITAILFSLNACVTTKSFNKDFIEEQKNGRDQKDNIFIETTAGERFVVDKLKYSTTGMGRNKQYWVTVGDKKINTKDVRYDQDKTSFNGHFYRSELGGTLSIKRLRFGKINLYYYEHPPLGSGANDVRGPFHMYVFEKQKGVFQELQYTNFAEAINDNKQALKKLQQLYPKEKIPLFKEKENLENLIAIVELYNK